MHSIGNPEIRNRLKAKMATHGLIGLVIQHHHKVNVPEIFESEQYCVQNVDAME